MTDDKDNSRSARVAALAAKHGITEQQASELLDQHGDDGVEETLESLAHFIRAPS